VASNGLLTGKPILSPHRDKSRIECVGLRGGEMSPVMGRKNRGNVWGEREM
jgi:hypothetical protein